MLHLALDPVFVNKDIHGYGSSKQYWTATSILLWKCISSIIPAFTDKCNLFICWRRYRKWCRILHVAPYLKASNKKRWGYHYLNFPRERISWRCWSRRRKVYRYKWTPKYRNQNELTKHALFTSLCNHVRPRVLVDSYYFPLSLKISSLAVHRKPTGNLYEHIAYKSWTIYCPNWRSTYGTSFIVDLREYCNKNGRWN